MTLDVPSIAPIDTGYAADDGNGAPLRAAFEQINGSNAAVLGFLETLASAVDDLGTLVQAKGISDVAQLASLVTLKAALTDLTAARVTYAAGDPTVGARSVGAKFGELVSIDDYFDAVRTFGVTDDVPALMRAATAAGPGGAVLIPSRVYFNSAVPRLANVSVIGRNRNPGRLDATANYADLRGQVRIGPGAYQSFEQGQAALPVGANAGWHGLVFLPAAILPFLPATTLPVMQSALATMQAQGALFDVSNVGGYAICDNLILGFGKAAIGNHRGAGQFRVMRNLMDCWAGWLVDSVLDIAWITDNELWPMLTALVPGFDYASNPATLNRGPYGFLFNYRADGVVARNNLSFGPDIGTDVIGCEGLRLDFGWSDFFAVSGALGGSIGIRLRGACSNIEINSQTIVIYKTAIQIDGTATGQSPAAVPGRPVRINGGQIAFQTKGVEVLNGAEVDILRANFESGAAGSTALVVGTGAGVVRCAGSMFKNIVAAVSYADAGVKATTFLHGNRYAGTPVPPEEGRLGSGLTLTRALGTNLTLEDTGNASGNGPSVLMRGGVAAGLEDFARVRAELVSATAGNEAVRIRFATNRNGALVERWDIHHEGWLVPVADNLMDIGQTTNRVRNLYLANNPIVGSDQRWKTTPENMSDAVLDAWETVRPVLFQYRDAVALKGADGARIHAGYIAQHVTAAFEAAGLDPFRYGLVGQDAVLVAVESPVTVLRPRLERVAVEETTLPPGMADFAALKASPPRYAERPVLDAQGHPVFDEVSDVVRSEEWTGETRLSLRYEQCMVVEAAYQRRRADRIEARLSALERRVPTA